MSKAILSIIFSLLFGFSYSQTITIGILTDKSTEQTKPLLEQLKTEITAVLGQERKVVFKGILENNFNKQTAETNYNTLVNSDAEIILSFGVVNNIVLYQLKKYPKPTIVFGSVNSDFIDLPKNQNTSNINNVAYLIAPFSYTSDLDVFKSLYNYKKIGIIVDEFLPKALPLETIFDGFGDDGR